MQQLHCNRYCSNIIEKRIRVGITVTRCFHWVGITETSTFCVGICQTSAIGITETQSVGIIQSPRFAQPLLDIAIIYVYFENNLVVWEFEFEFVKNVGRGWWGINHFFKVGIRNFKGMYCDCLHPPSHTWYTCGRVGTV